MIIQIQISHPLTDTLLNIALLWALLKTQHNAIISCVKCCLGSVIHVFFLISHTHIDHSLNNYANCAQRICMCIYDSWWHTVLVMCVMWSTDQFSEVTVIVIFHRLLITTIQQPRWVYLPFCSFALFVHPKESSVGQQSNVSCKTSFQVLHLTHFYFLLCFNQEALEM